MENEEHKKYHRRLAYITIVLILILFGSAAFYHRAEKWSYLDALYFSAATMTTVGYGDITPKTDAGKVFTIAFDFAGVGIALYGLSLIAAHFVEAREEFWLQRLGSIKIGSRTRTLRGKIRSLFSYEPEKLTKESDNHVKRK